MCRTIRLGSFFFLIRNKFDNAMCDAKYKVTFVELISMIIFSNKCYTVF